MYKIQRITIEMKGIKIGKEEIKLFLFTNNVVLYIETPKEYTHIYSHTNY